MLVCRGDLAGNENADKVRHAAQLGYAKLATQSSLLNLQPACSAAARPWPRWTKQVTWHAVLSDAASALLVHHRVYDLLQ